MKLSKKGFEKILDDACYFDEDISNYALERFTKGDDLFKYFYRVETIEFESNDFKDVVCLTVDEARYALKCVRFLASGCDIQIDQKSQEELWNYADKLFNRIRQVEGK